MDTSLHRAQFAILYALRHDKHLKFSALMQPTGMMSDTFKFHLQKLIKIGYVEKSNNFYSLTITGKEFANNLDKHKRQLQKQPKLSVLLSVTKQQDGQLLHLFQQRMRQPYYGYFGHIGGPVHWGESIVDAAKRELMKQTNLHGDIVVTAFCRTRDFNAATDTLLEDKLFVIVTVTNVHETLRADWKGGENIWMSLDAYNATDNHFEAAYEIIESLSSGTMYTERDLRYTRDDY